MSRGKEKELPVPRFRAPLHTITYQIPRDLRQWRMERQRSTQRRPVIGFIFVGNQPKIVNGEAMENFPCPGKIQQHPKYMEHVP